MTAFCVTFTAAKMAAFNSARLFVCFSSVSRGDENSQCPWWQLPNACMDVRMTFIE